MEEEKFRLNKFISHSGLCSRRKAGDLVKEGHIKVNGQVERNPAILVDHNDTIEYKGKRLKRESKKLYLLMNKPKQVITSLADEQGRKTVIDLIKDIPERIYPVGRLDFMTTGLLLLTNDGDLAQKLSHPSYEIKKVYHVRLDIDLAPEHLQVIQEGFDLEDGPIKVDEISYVNHKNELGVVIHSGRNRIVRRIFEHFNYSVTHLDRVLLGGLTKKNLPRGRYRHLTEQELIYLKHF